ncbi:MAG: hypothetical protein V1725_00600 [archaeon]
MIVAIDQSDIVLDKKLQHMCKKPFYGHPHGCPNYGKKKGCPPQPLLDRMFDFDRQLYVIYTAFPVGKFAERMHKRHADWTDRQCYNPRLWQGTARKQHDADVQQFLKQYVGCAIIKSPEAHGVNVSGLMQSLGVILDWHWPPKHSLENVVYQVSLGGHPAKKNENARIAEDACMHRASSFGNNT